MSQYHDLAEAMRKGAALRPQCFGSYFWQGASCAIGAAYEGATGRANEEVNRNHVLQLFPDIAGKGCVCPSCGESHTAYTMMVHLNDTHKWTREAIASWMDSLQVQP